MNHWYFGTCWNQIKDLSAQFSLAIMYLKILLCLESFPQKFHMYRYLGSSSIDFWRQVRKWKQQFETKILLIFLYLIDPLCHFDNIRHIRKAETISEKTCFHLMDGRADFQNSSESNQRCEHSNSLKHICVNNSNTKIRDTKEPINYKIKRRDLEFQIL